MKRYLISTAVAGLLFTATISAVDTPAVNFSAADVVPAFNITFSNAAGGFNLGYKFSVLQTLTVNQLGYYDDLGDGMIGNHAVGLYAADGTLLTSATVLPSDVLDGVFRYTAISPIDITPGDYVLVGVAGYDPGNPVDKYTHDPTSIVFDPNIIFIENRVKGGLANTLNFLTDADAEHSIDPFLHYGWFGPNMKTSVPVPEPGTLITLTGMGLLALRRKLKKQTT